MAAMLIPLQLTPGSNGVYLRNLCGNDELSVDATDTAQVLKFLEAIILHDEKGNQINPDRIVTADRDRLIAQLYMSLFGARIESTIDCVSCKEKFDLKFSLSDLLGHYPLITGLATDDGYYNAEPGLHFRLPNGEDEMLVQGLDADTASKLLFSRCCNEKARVTEREKVETKMAEIAPLLSLELQAVCPECNSAQQVQFDMQSFFLARLRQERSMLMHEVHCIAATYHWPLNEILTLPRSRRKQFASLIVSGN